MTDQVTSLCIRGLSATIWSDKPAHILDIHCIFLIYVYWSVHGYKSPAFMVLLLTSVMHMQTLHLSSPPRGLGTRLGTYVHVYQMHSC